MIISRPVLCSNHNIINYITNKFPSYLKQGLIFNDKENEIKIRNNLTNFYEHLESLVAYRNFFSEIEEKTKNKININLFRSPIKNHDITTIQRIYKFYLCSPHLGYSWHINKVDEISKELYHIFRSIERKGEIFVNDQHFTNFKINMKHFDYFKCGNIEIKVDTMHNKMRAFYIVEPGESNSFIKEMIKYHSFTKRKNGNCTT